MKKILLAVATFVACGVAKAQTEPVVTAAGGLNSALHGSLAVDAGIKLHDFWTVAATGTGSTQGVFLPGMYGGVDLPLRNEHISLSIYGGANLLFTKAEVVNTPKGVAIAPQTARILPLIGVRLNHYRAIGFDIRYTGYNVSVGIGWNFLGRKAHK